MWYPAQHQQQQQSPNWHNYMNTFPSQQQRTYSRTSYYYNTDESSIINRPHPIPTNIKNESFIHANSADNDDYNAIHNTNPMTNTEVMSTPTTTYHWSPVIKPSMIAKCSPEKPVTSPSSSTTSITSSTSSSSSSKSGCWDWLLYSPDIYSHLYTPSSSFVQQQQQDDDFDLLARLPSWLLALLYPSMKQIHTKDDENDSDQEITSLHNNHDEPLLSINNKISSNLSLSSEKLKQDRSSTPDTDDGYQSASDASRSDCSQQSSLQYEHHTKDDMTINNSSSLVPKRISYAAAVKPLPASPLSTKLSPIPTSSVKAKPTNTSPINDMLNMTNSQKLKFVAPRFERMHHAKQYSSPSTTTLKDSSTANRVQIRSNNNNNQRNHNNTNLTRRR